MNFSISVIQYGIIIAFVPVMIAFFYQLAKKLGVKEYTKEEIQQLAEKQYPKYYKTIYISLFVWLFLAIFVAGFVVVALQFLWLPRLSQFLFRDSQTLLFRQSSGWIQVVMFLYLISALFVTLNLFPLCLIEFIFNDFDSFCKVYESRRKKARTIGNISRLKIKPTAFIIIMLGLFLVAISLISLQVKSYIKISNEKIIISKFIDIRGKTYSWDKVKAAKLYGIYHRRHNYSSCYFDLILSDNTVIPLWTSDNFEKGFIQITKDELSRIIEKIKSEDIGIQIQNEYLQSLEGEEENDKEIGRYLYEKLHN